MTQEKIAYLKSQNWYPACYQNSISEFGHQLDLGFEIYLYNYINQGFSWGLSPQKWRYWDTLYVRLLNERL